MQVVGGHTPVLVAAQRCVGGGMGLGKVSGEHEHQGGRAMLGLSDCKVVVPDAMCAVVAQQE